MLYIEYNGFYRTYCFLCNLIRSLEPYAFLELNAFDGT